MGTAILHLNKGDTHPAPLHWCSIERPHSGTTPEQYRPVLKQPQGEYLVSFMPSLQGEDQTIPPIYLPLLLPSK